MLSESARMSSASEARFRVQAPNSMPRAIKVIALDKPSEGVVRRLASSSWNHASFFTAAPSTNPDDETALEAARAWLRDLTGAPSEGWLRDLAGGPVHLSQQVEDANLVVMVATPGHSAEVAGMIGRACSDKRVTTTALLVGSESVSDEAVAQTLAQLRPWSLMVVIANADDYIEDMLIALRGQ